MSPSSPTAEAPRSIEHESDIDTVLVRWLVGLRWMLACVLTAMLPVCEIVFGFHVRYAIALPVLGLVALVNVAASRRRHGGKWLALGVAFDLSAITAVIACSGGAANPFSALFIVHVALAASFFAAGTAF